MVTLLFKLIDLVKWQDYEVSGLSTYGVVVKERFTNASETFEVVLVLIIYLFVGELEVMYFDFVAAFVESKKESDY